MKRVSLNEFKTKLQDEKNMSLEQYLGMYQDQCTMNAQYNTMDNARRFVWDNRLREDCTLQIYDILCDIEFD